MFSKLGVRALQSPLAVATLAVKTASPEAEPDVPAETSTVQFLP